MDVIYDLAKCLKAPMTKAVGVTMLGWKQSAMNKFKEDLSAMRLLRTKAEDPLCKNNMRKKGW